MSPAPSHDPEKVPDNGVAEFDTYAAGYAAGMDHPIKRMMGSSERLYMIPKARWLIRDLARHPLPNSTARVQPALLDFGCGAGAFLFELQEMHFVGRLSGCDVSAGMLKQAGEAFKREPVPELRQLKIGEPAPYDDAAFDIVIVCCVLHHVPVAERSGLLADLWRLVKPGGRLYFFEHNPRNPLTRWVVKRTPIDRNAVLATPRQIVEALPAQARLDLRVEYILFFPPRWQWLAPLDRLLRVVPLGAQYAMVCSKTQE